MTAAPAQFGTIRYEAPAPRVVRIVLDRPETRNAQNKQMLDELDAAFDRADRDDDVSVVVLAAAGPHFSSGHDLKEAGLVDRRDGIGYSAADVAYEKEFFLGYCERWRNLSKPTIASVQGKVVAGGLMIMWPCDLIIAADDVQFISPGTAIGICGGEFFHEPWELGIRKAKELLFTGAPVSVEDAFRLGMVNRIVPRAELEARTLAVAVEIAAKPLFALKLAKEAVNLAQDSQGRSNAMLAAFYLHQLGHMDNTIQHGLPIDPSYLERTFGPR